MRRVAALLIGATALSWAGPAHAAEGDPLTGYWSRTRTGLPVPIQPPDPVPPGGTFVSGDPAGPVAVSALRTDLAGGLVGVELRLTIADSLGTPAVQACPSTDRWVPEQSGRLEAAPEADCSAPLDAQVDGEVLVVPLPPGLDRVNVLLRPKPGSSFSLTMEKATPASVVTAPAPSNDLPAAPPPAPAPPPPAQGIAQAPSFDAPFAPAVEAPIAVAQEPLLAAPVLPEAAAPVPAPAPQAAPAPTTFAAAPRPLPPVDERTANVLAAAIIAAVAAQAVRLARQPAAAPRALGGSARRSRPTPEAAALQVLVPARGVGRFRTEPVLGVRTAPGRGVGRFKTARPRPPVRI